MICVAGFVRQSLPTLAIFDPGRACGIPYAPELGLVAYTSHMLSRMMMLLKQEILFFAVAVLIPQDLPRHFTWIGGPRLIAAIRQRALTSSFPLGLRFSGGSPRSGGGGRCPAAAALRRASSAATDLPCFAKASARRLACLAAAAASVARAALRSAS